MICDTTEKEMHRFRVKIIPPFEFFISTHTKPADNSTTGVIHFLLSGQRDMRLFAILSSVDSKTMQRKSSGIRIDKRGKMERTSEGGD